MVVCPNYSFCLKRLDGTFLENAVKFFKLALLGINGYKQGHQDKNELLLQQRHTYKDVAQDIWGEYGDTVSLVAMNGHNQTNLTIYFASNLQSVALLILLFCSLQGGQA